MGEGEHGKKSRSGHDEWVLKDSWRCNGEHMQCTVLMSGEWEACACKEPRAGFLSRGGGGGKHWTAVRKSCHSYLILRAALQVNIQLAWLFLQLLWNQWVMPTNLVSLRIFPSKLQLVGYENELKNWQKTGTGKVSFSFSDRRRKVLTHEETSKETYIHVA